MSFPPPPPDRAHLQYQPPAAGPAQSGPAGAYGPVPQRPDQILPGQAPPLSMAKPGSITGIQAILWILTALAGLGDIASAIGLVQYFSVFGLIGLAWALYSTVQALASGVHITRGKRWAWIWSLVSAILGLVVSAAAIVFGIVYIETGWVALLVGVVLGGLYGTLLGLLCAKSARQWILMHRIQRGEVRLPGGFAQAGPGRPGPADGPQRPETRPGSVALAAGAILLLAALAAWGVVNQLRMIGDFGAAETATLLGRPIGGMLPPWVHLVANTIAFIGALITAPLILKGRFGGRVFGNIWGSITLLGYGVILLGTVLDHADGYYDFGALPGQVDPVIPAFGWGIGRAVLAALVLVLLLAPGVRAWTPPRPASALIVVVPQAQYGAQPQYGPPQQGQYRQPYPPQSGPQPPFGG
ncbi:hypothetical protein GCM10009830_22210 [Glycomyces endophyticus]|uniref:Uncharacterized protein n=1 Tax=Glycomyces endophyticus TaxID=480996 RepID=A0ABN2GR69_9ACTN